MGLTLKTWESTLKTWNWQCQLTVKMCKQMHIMFTSVKGLNHILWRATIPFMDVPFHFIFTGLSWGNKPGWDLISRRYSLESSCCEACSFHGDVTKRKLGLSSCHINIPTLLAKKKGYTQLSWQWGHNRNFPRSANPSVGTLGFADFPRSNSPTSAPCSEWRAETMTDVFWGVLKVDPQSHSFQY